MADQTEPTTEQLTDAKVDEAMAEVRRLILEAYPASLRKRNAELEQQVAEQRAVIEKLNDERPFWLWYAMLRFTAEVVCRRESESSPPDIPCCDTSDCITEYCERCAARAFLRPIEDAMGLPDDERITEHAAQEAGKKGE